MRKELLRGAMVFATLRILRIFTTAVCIFVLCADSGTVRHVFLMLTIMNVLQLVEQAYWDWAGTKTLELL